MQLKATPPIIDPGSGVAISGGRSAPLGATPAANGVNFSVYSRDASSIELLLFDREDDAQPSRVISFDSYINRTYHYWHIFVPGVQAGQIYGYRVHGPFRSHRRDAF